MALTNNQIAQLRSLESGLGNIPSAMAGKLSAAGLVKKTGNSSGQRGWSNCRITEAGKVALADA